MPMTATGWLPWSVATRPAPTPLLIVHGTSDWLVPSAQAQALYLAAAQPKSLLLIEGARHAESVVVDRADLLMDGLARLLGSAR